MTRYDALRSILRTLPLDVPSPEVGVDDEGDIDLDWFGDTPSHVASLLIYESGEIGFAYLLGEQSSHGRFRLEPNGALPDSILCFIRAACAVEAAT